MAYTFASAGPPECFGGLYSWLGQAEVAEDEYQKKSGQNTTALEFFGRFF
jgi:hypothetical protein